VIERIERFLIPEHEYQRIFDELQAGDSKEAWEEFRLTMLSEWFRDYEQGLKELGYTDVGDLESYDWGPFTYSQNMTMSRGDEWWSVHRDNPRIVAVHGFSIAVDVPRDHARLRYHRESYCREFGETRKDYPFDKGHFIGHKLGGQIDNGIFAQRRDVNRGWGEHKEFYRMERFAQSNPGTFVFSRPIYGDGSNHPYLLEYGLLRPDKTWWVRAFPNRYSFSPFHGKEGYPEWRQSEIRLEREQAARRAARMAASKTAQRV